jgi:hypothetical protein
VSGASKGDRRIPITPPGVAGAPRILPPRPPAPAPPPPTPTHGLVPSRPAPTSPTVGPPAVHGPPPSTAPGGPAFTPERGAPRAVWWSLVLWVVDSVFSCVSVLLVSYVLSAAVARSLETGADRLGVDSALVPRSVVYWLIYQMGSSVVGAAATTFVLFGVTALVAWLMYRGAVWARRALLVWGAFTVLSTLVQLTATALALGAGRAGAAVGLLSVVHIALVVAAVALMMRPGASAWFDGRRL